MKTTKKNLKYIMYGSAGGIVMLLALLVYITASPMSITYENPPDTVIRGTMINVYPEPNPPGMTFTAIKVDGVYERFPEYTKDPFYYFCYPRPSEERRAFLKQHWQTYAYFGNTGLIHALNTTKWELGEHTIEVITLGSFNSLYASLDCTPVERDEASGSVYTITLVGVGTDDGDGDDGGGPDEPPDEVDLNLNRLTGYVIAIIAVLSVIFGASYYAYKKRRR